MLLINLIVRIISLFLLLNYFVKIVTKAFYKDINLLNIYKYTIDLIFFTIIDSNSLLLKKNYNYLKYECI